MDKQYFQDTTDAYIKQRNDTVSEEKRVVAEAEAERIAIEEEAAGSHGYGSPRHRMS
jgi:hypothetical protein